MNLELVCKILNVLMGALLMYLWMSRAGTATRKFTMSTRKKLIALAVTVVLLGSFFVGFMSYQTDKAVRDLTRETQQCYRELAETLTFNNEIRKDNDDLSLKQRDALADTQVALYAFLHELMAPPLPIAALPPDDQRRRDFNRGVSEVFSTKLRDNNRIIADAKAQQDANEKSRKPLPSPTCGLQ